jgi:hypothetical protein
MKKLAVSLMIMMTGYVVFAQNEYKTALKNNPDSRIEIQIGSQNVDIRGHDKDEIIIHTEFKGEYVDVPSGTKKQVPDRASGLKPITVSPADNTGIGLVVNKEGNTFSVLKISQNAINKSYIFYIPNKAKLMVMDINAQVNTTYTISAILGEVEVNVLNSQLKFSDISGPVVANSTNGNVEIVYGKVTPNKPNSIVSVNGYVDMTIPKDVSIDIELNTVNGEAYTDWDIQTDKEATKNRPVIPNMNMFHLKGTINGGGTPFTIQSVNGDIYLRKGK